jgi:beta-barrel assembly-enhancing protease
VKHNIIRILAALVLLALLSATVFAQEKNPKPKKKDHADIENIGNRNINDGWNPFSGNLEKEIAVGRTVARDLESQVKLLTDPTVSEYVNRIGQNIVKNSDAKVPFTIKVIEDDEINAVSLPGGFFYVNSGLILAADDEAELAGVMAHEIAHVAARHAMEQQGKGQIIDILATGASIFTGGIAGVALQQGLGLGLATMFYKFDRNAEVEADWLGLQYLYKSGYDPGASVSFFEKLQARESARKKTSSIFATHPPTEDRVKETKENIEQFLPGREQYIVTTSEFQNVKALLARLQDEKRPAELEKAPRLRRPSSGSRVPADERDTESSSTDRDREGGSTKPEDREPDSDAPPVLRRPQERQQ